MDFEINGRKFKAGKLNAFKQFHVVRRLAPVLADLLPAMKSIQKTVKDSANMSESEKFDQFAEMLGPALMGLSKLSDSDAEFVLYGLCSAVEVNLNGAWSKVSTENMLMVQDLTLPVLLQIAGRSFAANLSDFFAILPAASPAAR